MSIRGKGRCLGLQPGNDNGLSGRAGLSWPATLAVSQRVSSPLCPFPGPCSAGEGRQDNGDERSLNQMVDDSSDAIVVTNDAG